MSDAYKIGYGRVSMLDQNPDSQADKLIAAGCTDGHIYVDKATGKHANRPELRTALKVPRKGDEFTITKLDRLGRSIRDLYEIADSLAEREVRFTIIDTGMTVNFNDPFGKMFFGQLALFAEFERDLIAMRTNEGLAAARARGRTGGRKSKLTPAAIGQARLMYEAKDAKGKRLHTVAEIASAFNVTRGTIYRALERTEQAPIPAQLPPLPDDSTFTDFGPATHLQGLADLLSAGAKADQEEN
ncbi:recombinase family protein [Streptomyces chumphonensis]|uniref:recombinase family protein n=1 Tax=Streptomyces chumphonensis TaxID=1214925 RepID=UPI003D72A698